MEHHRSLIKQLGPTYKFRLPGKGNALVMIADPKDARILLSNDGNVPLMNAFDVLEKVRNGPLKKEYIVPGLVSQGEDWKVFRNTVQQDMMRPQSALFYIDKLADVVEEALEKISISLGVDGEVKELNHVMKEFAFDATGQIFLGNRLGVLKGSEEGRRMMDAIMRNIDLLVVTMYLPTPVLKLTPYYWQFVESNRTIVNITRKKITEAIEKHEIDGSLDGSILGKLLKRCGKDSPIPIVMATDALIAGIDTTGNTATFLLYHLACHPGAQEALYQEILEHIGQEEKMTESALSNMKFLKACIQESQRLLPVVNMTFRRTQVDLVLGGYHIPAGTQVARHGVIPSNDEQFFPRPEKYIPERWIRGSPYYQKIDSFASLPFGHGPRSCVGQRFPRMILYMVAFKFVQKYKLEYTGPPVQVDYTGLGKPTGDVKFKLNKR